MNNRLPKRRTKPRRTDRRLNPSHLQWVRGHDCSVANSECSGKIEAAHVRRGTDGGMSKKPSDCYALSLCKHHHEQQHRLGEKSFEALHGIDMLEVANLFWRQSPHRYKSESAA